MRKKSKRTWNWTREEYKECYLKLHKMSLVGWFSFQFQIPNNKYILTDTFGTIGKFLACSNQIFIPHKCHFLEIDYYFARPRVEECIFNLYFIHPFNHYIHIFFVNMCLRFHSDNQALIPSRFHVHKSTGIVVIIIRTEWKQRRKWIKKWKKKITENLNSHVYYAN